MSGSAPDCDPSRRRPRAPDTLKKRAEFLKLAKGLRRNGPTFALQVGPATGTNGRFGFTVTKKTGNAPERNRIRRRLRAAVAELPFVDAAEVDAVIVARRECLAVPFSRLVADLSARLASARIMLARDPALPTA